MRRFLIAPLSARAALVLGAGAALAYFLALAMGLAGQGIGYDEAALSYDVTSPGMFSPASPFAVLKAWLCSLSSSGFTPVLWRLPGIILASLSIFLLVVICSAAMPAMCVFFAAAAITLGPSVYLALRFDAWQFPVPFFLRIAYCAFTARLLLGGENSRGWMCLSGVTAGQLVIWDAGGFPILLSLPLAAALSPLPLSRAFALAGAGFASGAVSSAFISIAAGVPVLPFARMQTGHFYTGFDGFLAYTREFSGMGAGAFMRRRALGLATGFTSMELFLFAALIAGVLALRRYGEDGERRCALFFFVSYAAAWAGLFGGSGPDSAAGLRAVPFLYMAVASSLPAVMRGKKLKFAVLVALAAFISWRVVIAADTVAAAARGAFSSYFNPQYDALGRLASERKDSVFIFSNWGAGAQAARHGAAAFEPFWRYAGPDDIKRILSSSPGRRYAYVVLCKRHNRLSVEDTVRILDDAKAAGWLKPVPPEPEFLALTSFYIRKYEIGAGPHIDKRGVLIHN